MTDRLEAPLGPLALTPKSGAEQPRLPNVSLLVAAVDLAVSTALETFFEDLHDQPWHGRERELVSLFAFGHLVPAATPPHGPFAPSQLGIEVAVPQLKTVGGRRTKPDVCKDLVVWSQPRSTCWKEPGDNSRYPLAVLEWKSLNNVGRRERRSQKLREHEGDLAWLSATSRLVSPFIGYAILVDLAGPGISLQCSRVESGLVVSQWLSLKAEHRARSPRGGYSDAIV